MPAILYEDNVVNMIKRRNFSKHRRYLTAVMLVAYAGIYIVSVFAFLRTCRTTGHNWESYVQFGYKPPMLLEDAHNPRRHSRKSPGTVCVLWWREYRLLVQWAAVLGRMWSNLVRHSGSVVSGIWDEPLRRGLHGGSQTRPIPPEKGARPMVVGYV